MTLQDRIDDRHLVATHRAKDGARRRVEAAVARLEKARATGADATWILACSRALKVAQQQHVEASAEVAAAEQALRLTASVS
jgi:hypothetical protein